MSRDDSVGRDRLGMGHREAAATPPGDLPTLLCTPNPLRGDSASGFEHQRCEDRRLRGWFVTAGGDIDLLIVMLQGPQSPLKQLKDHVKRQK